ncbi:DEAD/DEAH box helicase [Ferruginibacter sp. HRS2-29]|uniref:DEAD/DEAH box helicase n=1 Tax=Ferruginibacter sp. HRS2-29 TaxID=2487334 RepID=UPI0020CB7195|nr:DEAD/DEAH box helicase [Ferruginibacter sp. HRS2-29]MCP9750538.1 ATP-dependent helicase [Ferruginibacter sp. HRS2-29]
MIDIDKQRENYLNATGKIVLNACPGSGKTTIISYKLWKLIEASAKKNLKSGIACLSFTNVAKEEIKERYSNFSHKSIQYPNVVSTIDSFINNYITLPYFYLLTSKFIRPTILENASRLDSMMIPGLFKYDSKQKKSIAKHLSKTGDILLFQYAPSLISKDLNDNYTYDGKKPDPNKVEIAVFENYAKTIKEWQLRNGILTHSDSIVVAYKILNKFPHVCKGLLKRFQHIIIDEAQDTSEIQHAIFDKLVEHGLLNLELVGDPYQCIYAWRDAKPKTFIEKFNDPLWTGLELSDNWRSTQSIIDTYAILRKAGDYKITARTNFKTELPIYIIRFSKGNEAEALKKYQELCKDYTRNQAVTRGTTLSSLLNDDGNGAMNYWKNPNGIKLISCIAELRNAKIKTAIDNFREIAINIKAPDITYTDKRKILADLKVDYDWNSKLNQMLNKFSDFNLNLNDWTSFVQKELTSVLNLSTSVNLELKKGTFRPAHKKMMNDLFTEQKRKWNFPVTTIHQVKGMTLDSILLFLGKDRRSISIGDLEACVDEFTENQTMMYVAMSRPRYLLAIAIEDAVQKGEIEKKFLKKIEFV